jgi:NitT/TauT family transport system ATP-binding protein
MLNGAEVAVQFDEVSFRYKTGLLAIKGMSLEVPKGSTFAIVGPSGGGKTTLLRMIAGLSHPTAGRVLRRVGQQGHGISMLFQQDTLMPWRTVEQNVMFYHDLHRHRQRRATATRQRCLELLAMVGLSDYLAAYPHQLSGGMRRRVALVAALAPDPAILLLDEPFSSIDEPTRIGIHQELLRLLEQGGSTMIITTHDLNEAISLCDRVAVLSSRPGHIVEVYETKSVGAKDDLLSLRQKDEYLNLYARVWSTLSPQIRASAAS